MNLKALTDKTRQIERDSTIEERYGHVFNEYEMWILDRYFLAINETKDKEDYLRHVIYSFLALRDTFRN